MDITILPEDFDNDFLENTLFEGYPLQFNNPGYCPLAKAIRRQEGAVRVSVHVSFVCIGETFYSYMGNYFTADKAIEAFKSKQPYRQHLQEETI